MKTPTSAELAFLRRRAEQTFQRMPVLPRREDGRMTPESRLRFELSMESILENNRTLGACVVLRRPSGQYDVFCHGTARLSGRVPVTEETCFRIASVSKLVMTFGVLALCERGALNLDDVKDEYYPFALEQAQTDYFESQADAWTEALNPQYDLSKFFAEN